MSILKDLNDITIYFSDCIGIKIYNHDNVYLGKLSDIFVDFEEIYPTVLAIQFKKNNSHFYVHWEKLKEFNYKRIIVQANTDIGRGQTFPRAKKSRVITSLLANQFQGETIDYPPVGKVILDRQIVDTSGKKVVRVNDIELIKTSTTLRVTQASVGLRSMMRRLGYQPFVDTIVKLIKPNAKYLKNEKVISWKYVHAIPNRNISNNVKLNLSNEDLVSFHPADLADILEDLDAHAREVLFSELNPRQAAETLSEVDHDMQNILIKNEDPSNIAKIIEEMDTDDAADILSEFSDRKQEAIISKITDDEVQEEIQDLLEYDEDTAGGLMSTEVFEVYEDYTKSKVLDYIQENHEELETIYDLYIINNHGSLLGTCSLRELLSHKHDIKLKDIMNAHDIKSLTPDTHWKKVASFMSKYNLINVPITSDQGSLLGIVSVDDVLPWLLDER